MSNEQMPNPSEPTAEQISAELQTRIQNFNAELIPLLRKYKLGLGAQPLLTTDGRVAARPVLVDDSNREVEKVEAPQGSSEIESGE